MDVVHQMRHSHGGTRRIAERSARYVILHQLSGRYPSTFVRLSFHVPLFNSLLMKFDHFEVRGEGEALKIVSFVRPPTISRAESALWASTKLKKLFPSKNHTKMCSRKRAQQTKSGCLNKKSRCVFPIHREAIFPPDFSSAFKSLFFCCWPGFFFRRCYHCFPLNINFRCLRKTKQNTQKMFFFCFEKC